MLGLRAYFAGKSCFYSLGLMLYVFFAFFALGRDLLWRVP